MKTLLMIMTLMAWAGVARAENLWTDDFAAAKEAAKAQNKVMLLNFTGSDWCGWCIRLQKEVFSKDAFKEFAKENLILVEIDFPRRKSLSAKVQEQNDVLQRTFDVAGYPTIILLDPNGKLIGQTGYQAGGAAAYVAHLKALIAPHVPKEAVPAVTEAAPSTDAPAANVVRTWTSVGGSTVEAEYQKSLANLIQLKRIDGTEVRIALSSLSEADLSYLRSIKAIP
jgi:protein disulfide-isomerase